MSKTITIRIDDHLGEMVDHVSNSTGRTKSEIIRDSLRRQLSNQLFDSARERLVPLAEKKGLFTDDDVFEYLKRDSITGSIQGLESPENTDAYPIPSDNEEGSFVSEQKHNPIKQKSFEFALKIVQLYEHLQDNREYVLSKQILRSGTSIGANVEEATAAESRRDFVHKLSIASKEARETNYWLRLLKESGVVESSEIVPLLGESTELVKMLTAIVKTTTRRSGQ